MAEKINVLIVVSECEDMLTLGKSVLLLVARWHQDTAWSCTLYMYATIATPVFTLALLRAESTNIICWPSAKNVTIVT